SSGAWCGSTGGPNNPDLTRRRRRVSVSAPRSKQIEEGATSHQTQSPRMPTGADLCTRGAAGPGPSRPARAKAQRPWSGPIVKNQPHEKRRAFLFRRSPPTAAGLMALVINSPVLPYQPLDDPIPEPIPQSNIAVRLKPIATGLTAPISLNVPGDGTDR